MTALIPSATVVVLREINNRTEVLLLKRNSAIAYGGMWVFPGGKIDDSDYATEIDPSPADPFNTEMITAARNAAFRETQEEAGLCVSMENLSLWSHWTTPSIRSKRFSTWFFIVPSEGDEVTVDGGEIHEHCWRTPEDAIEAHRRLEIELAPPTYITLLRLGGSTMDEIQALQPGNSPEVFIPKVEVLPNGLCYFYHGDTGYEQADHKVTGRRHRLYASKDRQWVYERD